MSFNPHFVPSITVEGVKREICASCHGEWNKIHRVSKGLKPEPLHPMAFKAQREV
jgi:hypothetical protein